MYIHQAPLQFNFGVCIVLCNAHKCINANTLHLLYVCDYEELAMIFYKIWTHFLVLSSTHQTEEARWPARPPTVGDLSTSLCSGIVLFTCNWFATAACLYRQGGVWPALATFCTQITFQWLTIGQEFPSFHIWTCGKRTIQKWIGGRIWIAIVLYIMFLYKSSSTYSSNLC